ncbi:hypothetical protein BLNAU_20585 [Blattamonas nauphoetae]|uniref:Uncharacterized protein n=1 Tax=Blattamonas nauphoetae TaxID=2049346 RepID=A0ABQ9WYS7_9EUKA|nr:hypothetical protein BLNAU_20585 [Blattamonas nauphoetae]
MFFLFALLSASSFRSRTSNSIGPDVFGMNDIDSDAGTATLWMKFLSKSDIVAGKPIVITFVKTPILDEDNPVLVDITIPKAVALGDDLNYTHIINDIGESLLLDTMYSLYSYQHNSDTPTKDLPSVEFFVAPKKLGVQLIPITQTKYALECELKYNVKKDTKIPITLTAGKTVISPDVTFPSGTKTQKVELDVVTVAADNKHLAGTKYTISCKGYYHDYGDFVPEDNSVMIGNSTLNQIGDVGDGAVDQIELLFINTLFPKEADLPEGYTQKLTLKATSKETGTKEHILDRSEKFSWVHSDRSVYVTFVFKDCPIKANSTVTASLEISDILHFMEQPMTYAQSAKSVAAVVAALFAVIAFVF